MESLADNLLLVINPIPSKHVLYKNIVQEDDHNLSMYSLKIEYKKKLGLEEPFFIH
jgi:hypothetical protein